MVVMGSEFWMQSISIPFEVPWLKKSFAPFCPVKAYRHKNFNSIQTHTHKIVIETSWKIV